MCVTSTMPVSLSPTSRQSRLSHLNRRRRSHHPRALPRPRCSLPFIHPHRLHQDLLRAQQCLIPRLQLTHQSHSHLLRQCHCHHRRQTRPHLLYRHCRCHLRLLRHSPPRCLCHHHCQRHHYRRRRHHLRSRRRLWYLPW